MKDDRKSKILMLEIMDVSNKKERSHREWGDDIMQ